MQSLQDMITELNKDLEASKEKMSKMEVAINDNEFNQKKGFEQLDDKVQIERCVNEMVSWVAE